MKKHPAKYLAETQETLGTGIPKIKKDKHNDLVKELQSPDH